MTFQLVFILLILIGAVLHVRVIAQNNTNEQCGIQASGNQYPWLVGIVSEHTEEPRKRIICNAALISRIHVISIVKCFDDSYSGVVKSVLLGSSTINRDNCDINNNGDNCTNNGVKMVAIETVITHPEFTKYTLSSKSSYDIALVILREIVPYTEFIRPICLPSADITQSAVADLKLYLIATPIRLPFQNKANADNDTKVVVPVTYVDNAECKMLLYGNPIPKDVLCCTDAEYISSCLLGGGLLMNKIGDKYELVGMVNWFSGCSTTKLFINIKLYVDWIRRKISEWQYGCGRRKVDHVALLTNGELTKPGDWPWHVAIYRLKEFQNKYICGGTLISKSMVLTAAHCTILNRLPVRPEILRVILGKHYLDGIDLQSQECEVQSVIAHEDFAPHNYLANDIALLTLKTEASYSDYIQPACIWYSPAYDRLPTSTVFGTVVGWGIDQSDSLSSHLHQAHMPMVSDVTCIDKKPVFYADALKNKKKFCAGWANGTSPCNGDSGGGYLVFVPDTAKDNSSDARGAWYIRGIVSITVALRNYARCDPNQYSVFTDVDKYADWINRHLENN